MIAIVPIIAALIGAAVYLLAANPKATELGLKLYFAGVLVALWATAGHAVRLLAD